MRFRKKPVVIEAHPWFKNGDHPLDLVSFGSKTSTGHLEDMRVLLKLRPRDNIKGTVELQWRSSK